MPKFKCDNLSNFQTMWYYVFTVYRFIPVFTNQNHSLTKEVCVTDNKRSLLESFICLTQGCVTSKVSTGRRRHINQKHLFVAKTIKKAVAVELSSFPNEGKLTEGKKISKAHLFFFLVQPSHVNCTLLIMMMCFLKLHCFISLNYLL